MKPLISAWLTIAAIQTGISENAELRKICCVDAENIILSNIVVLLYFEEKKQDRAHRFDFTEYMPSKKDLQEQGLQRLSENGKDD